MLEEAIILAGGFGTRLKSVTGDVPKPMADINGRPFLACIFDYLKKGGVRRAVLSVHYNWEFIKDYFKDEFEGISLAYSIEETPLGTGGAIRKSFEFVSSGNALVLNGDTYFPVDLRAMAASHEAMKAKCTIALKEMRDFDRYGTVEVDASGRVRAFQEKRFTAKGFINGGVYIVEREMLAATPLGAKFSFEKDVLEGLCQGGEVGAFESDAYFVDIGIPEDYKKAVARLR